MKIILCRQIRSGKG